MTRLTAGAALLAASAAFAAAAFAHDHGAHQDDALAESYVLGDLTITEPFSRATLPRAPVAGGFLTVTNTGTADDRLVAATSEVAGRTEIHEMAMVGDVMQMRERPDGIPIPAGETVELKPGGYHLMFMELAAPFVEGELVEVVLSFEMAGEIAIALEIGAPNARGTDHGAHGGHGQPAQGQ